MHLAFENALRGVILDQIGKIVGWHEIVDCDDFIPFFKETLFDDGTENETTDAAEPVDGDIRHVGWCWVARRGGRTEKVDG